MYKPEEIDASFASAELALYNPEEDIVPHHLLEQALMISKLPPLYKVYFDSESGDIISISNETTDIFLSSVDMEFNLIKDFFNCKKNIKDYKVIFIDQTTPTIVKKDSEDVDLITIEEVNQVDHWDSIFTIENFVLLKKWGFQLRPDQRKIFMKHNLNTSVEVFIVDKDYDYELIRSFKVLLSDVISNNRFYIDYIVDKEAANNKILVKKFFLTTGYQVLYDPEI